ncbi:Oidioi.mRNA.OKI2018_I69.XSR.g13827.t1.cds [Oikopleura dioica]|uniref:Oidioi.mRNA.OKI2018_I69.XSR.g13827.t1.cds n=1 Tax=Oikopleura dioica TaxID=34765 RepID=A0ABN7SBZ8_OIKDI|nr:Oidioi.mRNA.OKI2018_I69.XSR.g13827.t1.cds [Oikopleura dioica]
MSKTTAQGKDSISFDDIAGKMARANMNFEELKRLKKKMEGLEKDIASEKHEIEGKEAMIDQFKKKILILGQDAVIERKYPKVWAEGIWLGRPNFLFSNEGHCPVPDLGQLNLEIGEVIDRRDVFEKSLGTSKRRLQLMLIHLDWTKTAFSLMKEELDGFFTEKSVLSFPETDKPKWFTFVSNAIDGTSQKFQPTMATETNPGAGSENVAFVSYSAMDHAKQFSIEELRMQDYLSNRKAPAVDQKPTLPLPADIKPSPVKLAL